MPKYPTEAPPFPGREWILSEIGAALDEKRLSMDEHVAAFEDEFASYCNCEHGIATNACTSALEATLRAIGVEGQDVIVPVQTFVATGSAVVTAGGRPVFADIDSDHFCLSVESVREQIHDGTAAVILVEFAGFVPPEIEELRDLCDQHNATLIEDAAHAHGATRDGKRAGSFGDAGCFSFNASKNMTTGEGGMVVTDDDDLATQVRSICNRGLDPEADGREFSTVGSNYRMSELAAILGRSQLDHLDEFIDHRNVIARTYDEKLASAFDSGTLRRVGYDEAVRHSYWRYTLVVPDRIERPQLRKSLAVHDVAVDWAYPPLHLLPVFRERYDTHEGMCPVAERLLDTHICLPSHVGINEERAATIADVLEDALAEQGVE